MKHVLKILVFGFFILLCANAQGQNYYFIHDQVNIRSTDNGAGSVIYELANGNDSYFFHFGGDLNRNEQINFSSNQDLSSLELRLGRSNNVAFCESNIGETVPVDNICNPGAGYRYFNTDSCTNWDVGIAFVKLGSFKSILTSTSSVNICERQTLDFFDETTYCSLGKIPYGVEYSLSANWANPQVLLAFGEHDTRFTFLPSDITNDPNNSIYMRVRRSAAANDYMLGTSIYNLDGCSVELDSMVKEDAMCYNENGKVTLTFEENVDQVGGYEMRYYVYEKPDNAPANATPASVFGNGDLFTTDGMVNGVQAADDVRFSPPDPITNPNGQGYLTADFMGTYGGLGAGTYYILYQEINFNVTPVSVKSGELTPDFFTIEEPSEILITEVETIQPQCVGDKGSINITAVGGGYNNTNGVLEYLLSVNGAPFIMQDNSSFTNLDDGFYEIVVRNKVNPTCDVTYPSTITITSPPELLFTSTSPGIASSPLATDGQISAVYEGGTAGYTFELTKTTGVIPATVNEVTNTTNQTITYSGLDIGTYQIEITDANDCKASSGDIAVTAAPLPTLGSPTYTDITCSGNSDGEFSIPVSYGAANNIPTTISYRLLDSGNNQIRLGTIEIDDDPITNHEITISDLASGNYTLAIVASTGDFGDSDTIVTSAIIIDPVDPIAIDFSTSIITNASCNGLSDGSVQLSVSGSTEYQYALSNFPTASDWVDLPIDNTIRNLAGRTYSIILRNKNNTTCQSIVYSNAFEIIEPEALTVNDTSINATTIGGSEGSISLTITGGTPNTLPNDPYAITWTKQAEGDPGPLPFTDTDTSTPYEIIDLEAATYRATITDLNTCTTNPSPYEIVIVEPGELMIIGFSRQQDVSCNGANDGVLTATVQGSIPVTYNWIREADGTIIDTEVNSANSATLTGVGPGEYRLSVQDASIGPIFSTNTVIIEEPAAISATIDLTPSCFNGNTGTITISGVTGGTLDPNPNYTYSIDNGATFLISNTFANVPAGDHIVVIQEEGGCTYTETVTIAPTPDIVWNQASTIVNNISAAGQMDGSISPFFDGGFDDGIGEKFSFLWTGPNVGGITDQNISGLGAGAYSVQVTDDNGCIINQPFTIAEPGALSITIADQQNPCFGQTNGSITAAVAGTGPYTLQWSEALLGDLVGETGLTLSNIGEGTYTLNVIDLGSTPNAVGNSPAVALVEPQAITADTNTTPSCAINGSGTIVVSNVQGGEPGAIQDYTYSTDGINFQDGPLFENLTAQTYSVWVRDGNGCDGIFSGVTVAPSPDILWDEPNTVITNATAQGASDGTITLAFTSDATNYTYNWNGPGTNNETTQNLTGKAAGVYTVIVTNENGCTLERIFTIAEPGILTITINSAKNPCFGENNGNIQTTVVGTGNLSYQWSEAVLGDLGGETGPNLNNVPAGTYTLTVTDDAVNPPNVVSSNPITLSDPAVALDAQAAPTDAQCAGVSDGMVTITASGGIPPYEYSIDGGANYQPGATFNNLGLGSYSFRVRDSNQCVADATATINEPPIITLSFVATPLSAAGASDGAIDIAASGGTGDLNFSWVGPAGFTPTTDEDISGLIAGDYTVTVADENGCTLVSNPITIDEPGAIIITLTLNEEILCNGDEFAEILADVQGGVPDYTYQWFQEGNNTPLGETTNLISNLGAGNYFLRVTDANGINRDSNILPITEPTVLQVALQNKVDIVCSGEASGIINITIQGGTAPYTFQWNNGADSQNLANIEAGDYFVEVFDDNGCFELLEVTINPAPNALQLDATVTNVSEYLANNGSISLDITGGATPYTINWTRDSDNTPVGNTASITALSADSYTVTVSDANGCNVTENYEVTQPDIVEDSIVQPSCQGDSNGSISVLVNQGNGTFTYLWNTGETTNAISNLGAGDYTVTITGFGNGPLTRTYTLVDPLPLEVDLGQDRVLCVDQVLELDATVEDDTATYTWTSDTGFSSSNPQVTLTTTGNYTVTVQTASGCTAVGTLSLEVSTDEINAEFAMSSQVFTGDILVAVDISFPLPDTIEWVVPDGATIVKQDSDEAEFIFNQAGEYEIGIITARGDCIAQKTKKVLVVAKDGSVGEDESNDANKQVEDFIIYPNPTTGRFTADVSLTEPGNISIKVFSFANNALMASERGRGETSYSIPFDISGMPSGVYAVVLETPYGTSLRKIVVR